MAESTFKPRGKRPEGSRDRPGFKVEAPPSEMAPTSFRMNPAETRPPSLSELLREEEASELDLANLIAALHDRRLPTPFFGGGTSVMRVLEETLAAERELAEWLLDRQVDRPDRPLSDGAATRGDTDPVRRSPAMAPPRLDLHQEQLPELFETLGVRMFASPRVRNTFARLQRDALLERRKTKACTKNKLLVLCCRFLDLTKSSAAKSAQMARGSEDDAALLERANDSGKALEAQYRAMKKVWLHGRPVALDLQLAEMRPSVPGADEPEAGIDEDRKSRKEFLRDEGWFRAIEMTCEAAKSGRLELPDPLPGEGDVHPLCIAIGLGFAKWEGGDRSALKAGLGVLEIEYADLIERKESQKRKQKARQRVKGTTEI